MHELSTGLVGNKGGGTLGRAFRAQRFIWFMITQIDKISVVYPFNLNYNSTPSSISVPDKNTIGVRLEYYRSKYT